MALSLHQQVQHTIGFSVDTVRHFDSCATSPVLLSLRIALFKGLSSSSARRLNIKTISQATKSLGVIAAITFAPEQLCLGHLFDAHQARRFFLH